ncbi:MAG: NUDIX domain-containing protein [Chitinophagales bacterium]
MDGASLTRFNVRVYGLLMNENDQILVSDEVFTNGRKATKFPGGGLELGEGPIDCLIREFKEETGIDVIVTDHFYTTDFFQPSAFDNNSQLISIYYLVQSPQWHQVQTSGTRFDFEMPPPGKDAVAFRWVDITDLKHEADLNLPIDKVVVDLILNHFPKLGFRLR